MQTIYLHIGFGKTGSSALQVWLNQNASSFSDAGIDYPQTDTKLDDYSITSGNAIPLIKAIKKRVLPNFLQRLTKENDLLFSSEMFQTLSSEEITYLKNTLQEASLHPVIIAYVRDVYDVMYSTYQQSVKRQLGTRSFADFALEQKGHLQFEALHIWHQAFDHIRVIHYDTHKKCLDQSFLEALGLQSKTFPPMHKKKVNRSLTLMELELLRCINKKYRDSRANPSYTISQLVSDALISKNPEQTTPLFLDESVLDHFKQLFSEEIAWVNTHYFDGNDVLQIFNPKAKSIVTELPEIDPTLLNVIEILMDLSEIHTFETNQTVLKSMIKRLFNSSH